MARIGQPRDFKQKFRYLVEIDGIAHAGFGTASGLTGELGVSEYREGGNMIAHKKPGLLTFPDVTLERGATRDRDLYDWFKQAANAATGRGETANRYKRTCDIVEVDNDGSEVARWTLYGAWVRTYTAGDWDSTSEDATMETVVLAIDRFDKTL